MRAILAQLTCLVFFLSAPASAMDVTLPTDGSDATSAFDTAAATLCASSTDRTLRIATGVVSFLTRPAAFNCALNLRGEGIGGTILRRLYSNGSFLMWTRGIDQSGGSIADLTIEAGPGTHSGIAVYIQALPDTTNSANSYNRHSFRVDNILVGRTDQTSDWAQGIYFDGSANPDGNTNSVPGIRGIYISRSSAAGTTAGTVYLYTTRGANIDMECYVPLNGSFAGIRMDGNTQSVMIASRNCGAQYVDAASFGATLNVAPVTH